MNPDIQAYQASSDLRYEQLSHEVRTIKVQLATMNEVQKSDQLFKRVARDKQLVDFKTGMRITDEPPPLDYSEDEMRTQVQFDIPILIEKKEKLDNERVLIKQLLANIEKNRVKWRKDVFESDSLSLQRKVALQGVKDRIDQ